MVTQVLKTNQQAPNLEEYKQDFGLFAQSIYNSVCKARVTVTGGMVSPFGRQSLSSIASPGILIIYFSISMF